MTDCPIYLDDREVGRLRWAKEDGGVMIWGSCPFEKEYIYRLSVDTSDGGNSLYIGVMMPERGRFVISKKTSPGKCAFLFDREDVRADIDRRMPGEEERTPPLPFPFSIFKPVRAGETGCGEFIEDIFINASGLYAKKDGISYFAAAWEPGGELPVSAFFCLLTYFRYKDRGYCVLCVDGEGKLFALEQGN